MALCVVLVCVFGVVLASPAPPLPAPPPSTSPHPVLAQPDAETLGLHPTSPSPPKEPKSVVIVTAIAVDSQTQAPGSQIVSQTHSHLESHPESLVLESLSSETLQTITPTTDSHHVALPLSESPSPVESPIPAPNVPLLIPVFKRVTPRPFTPTPDALKDVPFQPSPIDTEIFGAKFFQSALHKTTSAKPAIPKPVFISKNVSLNPNTYQSVTSQPATTLPTLAQPAATLPTLAQPVATLPTLAQPASSLPTLAQPATTLPTLAQPATTLPTLPQPASSLPTPPHPSFQSATPKFSLPLLFPPTKLPPTHPVAPIPAHLKPYLFSPVSPQSDSSKTHSRHNAMDDTHDHTITSNLVLSSFGKVKPAQRSHPLPPRPYMFQSFSSRPASLQRDSGNTLGLLLSLGPLRLLPSPSKTSSSLVSRPSNPQPRNAPPNHAQPQNAPPNHAHPRNAQPLSNDQEKKGRSSTIPSFSLSAIPASRQYFSRSHAFEQRHPVFRKLARHIPEAGDESRAIAFSVAPPTLAAPINILTKSKGSPSHNFPSRQFTLPRPPAPRPDVKEEEKHEDKEKEQEEGRSTTHSHNPSLHFGKAKKELEEGRSTTHSHNPSLHFGKAKKELEEGRSITHSHNPSLHFGKAKKELEEGRSITHSHKPSLHFGPPHADADTRPARTVHSSAPPFLPHQEKAAAAPLPLARGSYHAKSPAQYEFSYQVSGGHGGAPFGHQESRDGPETRGSYVVPLPDGRVQRVTYYVSGDSGYRAEVTYEGEAAYPPPRPAYRTEPTHEGSAVPRPSPPYQPAPAYRSQAVHQPAHVTQHASQSQLQPTPSARAYRSAHRPTRSFLSQASYRTDLPQQPALWPAALPQPAATTRYK